MSANSAYVCTAANAREADAGAPTGDVKPPAPYDKAVARVRTSVERVSDPMPSLKGDSAS